LCILPTGENPTFAVSFSVAHREIFLASGEWAYPFQKNGHRADSRPTLVCVSHGAILPENPLKKGGKMRKLNWGGILSLPRSLPLKSRACSQKSVNLSVTFFRGRQVFVFFVLLLTARQKGILPSHDMYIGRSFIPTNFVRINDLHFKDFQGTITQTFLGR